MIRLDNLSRVLAGIHYLQLPVYNLNKIKTKWHQWQKHFYLPRLSANSLTCPHTICGVTLILSNIRSPMMTNAAIAITLKQHELARPLGL